MNRVTFPLRSWRSNDSGHISHRYGNQPAGVVAHKCRPLFPDFSSSVSGVHSVSPTGASRSVQRPRGRLQKNTLSYRFKIGCFDGFMRSQACLH